MDTTTGVVATGVVVTAGQWANEKSLTMKFFVGLVALAIFMSLLSSSNEKFAGQVMLLILATATVIYAVPISKKLGGLK